MNSLDRAKEKAAFYLARSNHTEKEVRDYLKRKDFSQQDIDATVAEFKEFGYIDDLRYCHSFFEYGMGKSWGQYRIMMELEKRGVPRQIASNEFQDYLYENGIDEDFERQQALEVGRKIVNQANVEENYLTDRIKGRIVRRLQSYGYSRSDIFSVISELEREMRDF